MPVEPEKAILGAILSVSAIAGVLALGHYEQQRRNTIREDMTDPHMPPSNRMQGMHEEFGRDLSTAAQAALGNRMEQAYINSNWQAQSNNSAMAANPGNSLQGTQLLSYQLYQQAVNAATPTVQQLETISGQPAGGEPNMMGSGSGLLGGNQYQSVDLTNDRAERLSECAQNAPTFVATSLLPKTNTEKGFGNSFEVTQANALASQNFLSATQQVGVDTVLSSLRNPSYDIRNNIPNPISVVSPWLNTTITPDLERRPLDCFVPRTGLYGCGDNGCNATAPSGVAGQGVTYPY